ncbi:LysR substrate-binding domain-containing protein [Polycladidibacter hongkongensis]|uniref:LysR substrate-binding domain-containing protein n=1 Tax=Polycladidibacter hongkongensis TaxID=1647556 RepID=UPI000830BE75|nr:LysR substrate-binding domain-containing protein [Pseudovibrio hongkongensis]
MNGANRPTLRQLQAFVAVVDGNGITSAARTLGISQPAVTNLIRTFEKEFEVPIFRRVGRRLLLTTAGEHVVAVARDTLNETNRMLDTIRYATGNSVAPLKIGYTAPQLVLSAAKRFRAAEPLVPLEFQQANSSRLFTMLDDFHLDLISIGLSEPINKYHCQQFAIQSLQLLVPKTAPIASQASLSINSLAGLPMIMREKGSYTRQLAFEHCQKAGFKPNVVLEIFGRESVREAVALGFGFTIILDREAGCDERLCAIRIDGCEEVAHEYLVCRKGSLGYAPLMEFFSLNI